MLNKQCIIFEFFTTPPKLEFFVLVVKPWEVIKVHVSMYISMLGIGIESYKHILSPPKLLFNSKKIKFSAILGHFLMV